MAFSHNNLHPQIAERILGLEEQRRSLFALSAYLSQAEHAMRDTFPEKDDVDLDISFFASGIYITIHNVTGLSEGTPLIRELVRRGWRIRDSYDFEEKTYKRVVKDEDGFNIRMEREVREDYTVNIEVRFLVVHDTDAPEHACRKVKVGETEELVKTPIYKVICPEGVEVLDVTADGS